MPTRFTKITNGLSSLGDKIDNDQKIRKVIRALPKSWEVKATTLKELNDREEMDFFGFISNLKTHEMKMKVREEREAPKKKVIAFKATVAPRSGGYGDVTVTYIRRAMVPSRMYAKHQYNTIMDQSAKIRGVIHSNTKVQVLSHHRL